MCWWCLGRVSVMSWWCVGDVSGVSRWCLCSVSVMLWRCLSDVWWCCGDVLVMVLRCFGDEYWWISSDFQWVPRQKEWLFDVSLLLGSYAELIFTWTLWMAVNFWAFWPGPAMRICLTTRRGNRWHEAEQKVQYQRRYATKMRAQPLFISRGVAWVMERNGEPMLETWVSTLLHGRRKLLYLSFADGWHPDFLLGGELMLVHCWTHWSNSWIRLFCSWMLTTQLSMTPSLPKALQLPLQRFSKFWPMPMAVEKKGLSACWHHVCHYDDEGYWRLHLFHAHV